MTTFNTKSEANKALEVFKSESKDNEYIANAWSVTKVESCMCAIFGVPTEGYYVFNAWNKPVQSI